MRGASILRHDWARSLTDAAVFAAEQAHLQGVWAFLGFASDAPEDGDWFRADIGGRSVFVQRFGPELRGFENLCRHRFHPLRTTAAGKGPIVCGYHHWRYDADGRAVDIPECEKLFGASPAALGARLNRIEVGVCGDFVFGRFPREQSDDGLADFLGDGFAILEAMSRRGGPCRSATFTAEANWRLCMQITMDGYHAVAVHPSSFGRNGYPDRNAFTYFRFGLHNGQFSTLEADAPRAMAAACRAGTWRSRSYRILQIFPGFVVSHFHGGAQNWYVCVQQFRAISPGRTDIRYWLYGAAFAPAKPRSWIERWTGPLTRPLRLWFVEKAHRKITGEDIGVCERQQTVAAQVNRAPILGALEERIGWFEQSYAEVVGRGGASSPGPPSSSAP